MNSSEVLENALIIFIRNPILGSCKTRLATKTGDKIALEIYRYLLSHTHKITKHLKVDKFVFYSDNIIQEDIWDDGNYVKKLQQGDDLGQKMGHAFSALFQQGYNHVVIIGSDILELTPKVIDEAFKSLLNHDAVLGPSKDGGYYLLGLNNMISEVFQNKQWGENTVLNHTKQSLKNFNLKLLKELNDIDTFDDLVHSEYFKTSIILQQLVDTLYD